MQNLIAKHKELKRSIGALLLYALICVTMNPLLNHYIIGWFDNWWFISAASLGITYFIFLVLFKHSIIKAARKTSSIESLYSLQTGCLLFFAIYFLKGYILKLAGGSVSYYSASDFGSIALLYSVLLGSNSGRTHFQDGGLQCYYEVFQFKFVVSIAKLHSF